MEKTEILNAVAGSDHVGKLIWKRSGDRLSFIYNNEWSQNPKAFPLSLSMPLTGVEYSQKYIEPFIVGLLPDNSAVLNEWAKRFKVSARNPFKLLKHVGEDCAGGIQFISPDRTQIKESKVDWLSKKDLANRIEDLMRNHGATRSDGYEGQFSLAGAQAKTAFLWSEKKQKWGVPSGAIPTTHIFKPCGPELEGHAENEHLCLRLAKKLGFKVANTRVTQIGNRSVIIVKRYDRIIKDGLVKRVHQEDMCQSLGYYPQWKYQSEGGPSPKQIINHIITNSSSPQVDKSRFIDALIFNFLIGGTDAHSKNYSLLIAGGGQVRLAPLYDIASIFPYNRLYNPLKTKLAMQTGGQYKMSKIGKEAWMKAATEWNIAEESLTSRFTEIAHNLTSATQDTVNELQDEGLTHPVIKKASEKIVEHTQREAKRLA